MFVSVIDFKFLVDIGFEASLCGGCAVSISRSRILVAAEQQSSYNCPQLQKMNTWIAADCELSKGQYSGTFWGIFFVPIACAPIRRVLGSAEAGFEPCSDPESPLKS